MAFDKRASGLTAFAPPPAPTYRFVVSSKAGQLDIWLENLQSKDQWSTGFLDENNYVTITNRIPNASVGDYILLFKDTLEYLMGDPEDESKGVSDNVVIEKIRRRLIEFENGALELEMSVKVRALSSAWATKFTFQLQPVSLERIDIVEAKLRDVEEELAKTKKCLAEEKANTVKKEGINLYAASKNVKKLNGDGKIIWDDEKHNNFELTSERNAFLFLVSGWYMLNLNVYLDPQTSGGEVQIHKNGEEMHSNRVPTSENTSVELGCSLYFEEEDLLEVVVTNDPHYVGGSIYLLKVGE